MSKGPRGHNDVFQDTLEPRRLVRQIPQKQLKNCCQQGKRYTKPQFCHFLSRSKNFKRFFRFDERESRCYVIGRGCQDYRFTKPKEIQKKFIPESHSLTKILLFPRNQAGIGLANIWSFDTSFDNFLSFHLIDYNETYFWNFHLS